MNIFYCFILKLDYFNFQIYVYDFPQIKLRNREESLFFSIHILDSGGANFIEKTVPQ